MAYFLKDLKARTDIVKSSDLEARIGKTLISQYVGVIDSSILSNFKKKSVDFPSMRVFFTMAPEYRKNVIMKYAEIMKDSVSGGVDTDVMAAQGALFDGLCFLYDAEKDSYCLVTMNFDLLYGLNVEYDMLKQVAQKNVKGFAKAYRVDIEYSNSSKEFTFKVVNARDMDIDAFKPDSDESKRFFLIPYLYIFRLMKNIEAALNGSNMGAFEITQDCDGNQKVRNVSVKPDIIAQYCDSAEAAKGVKAQYFPLKGFFYAPSLGTSSATSMVTNINIFAVTKIRPVDPAKQHIAVPKNPTKGILLKLFITNSMLDMKETNPDRFKLLLSKLPKNSILSDNIDDIGDVSISTYLDSVSDRTKMSIAKALKVDKRYEDLTKLLDSRPKATVELKGGLEKALKSSVCRIIIQKKSCKLSAILCTNDVEILKHMYGPDYEAVYEGFSYRSSKVYNELMGVENLNVSVVMRILSKYGFSSTAPVSANIMSIFVDKANDEEARKTRIRGALAEIAGVNLKRSDAMSKANADGNNILARSLTARVSSEGKIVDYYKNIDISKIESILVMG